MKKAYVIVLMLTLLIVITSCSSTIIRAADDGDIKEIKALLEKGADIEDINEGLFRAVYGDHIEIVKLLLENGADVNYRTKKWWANGYTPLGLLAGTGNLNNKMTQFLLSKGASIELAIDALEESMSRSPTYADQFKHYIASLEKLKTSKQKISTYTEPKFTDQMLLAVLDFEAKGVPKSEAKTATEWLRTEMINTGFQVIERSAMDMILKEQAFAMTGCTDTSCAVKVGKLLSAKKILIGNVEKWKDKVFINGRIIDVEKGVAEFAHKETVKSTDELDKGVARFAKNLARRIKGLPVEE